MGNAGIAPGLDSAKVEEIRALHAEGKSHVDIAAAVGCGKTTVRKYLRAGQARRRREPRTATATDISPTLRFSV